jgi:acyl-CoA thioesterase-1
VLLLGACAPWRAVADAGPRPVTYVAIGASDSVGIGARDPEREGWVPRFYRQLPAGSTLTNLGVSGSRLSQALDQQLPVAIAAHPDVVTVWLAVNDFTGQVPLERYATDLERLLTALELTGAKLLVGNLPDLSQPAFARGINSTLLQGRVDEWNATIADIVDRHGGVVVDLRSHWRELAEHPEYLAADGFHPSTAGYARLAELFWQALEASGGLENQSGG